MSNGVKRKNGWPTERCKGLSRTRRKAILGALGSRELQSIVGGDRGVVEEKLKGLLLMFGLEEGDCGEGEFEAFVDEARGRKTELTEVDEDAITHMKTKHWQLPTPINEALVSQTFIDTGRKVLGTLCHVDTRHTKHSPALLLRDNIILTSSLCMAHATHAHTATVTFCDYPDAPTPPITIPLNPKSLFVCGSGAGRYFRYRVLDLSDTQCIRIQLGVASDDIPSRKECFPATPPLPGSTLELDSIVSLDCTEGVLLKVIDEDGPIATLSAIEGSHGLTTKPRGCKGVVHRWGNTHSYVAVALKVQGLRGLTEHQQNVLTDILSNGHPLEPRETACTRGSLVSFTKHGMRCAVDCLTLKKSSGRHSISCRAPLEPSGGLVFDFDWNFLAFAAPPDTVLHFAAIVRNMRHEGFVDFVRGRVTQGNGLLDGRLLRTGPGKKQHRMEAEKLVWGDKGLDFTRPLHLPSTLDECFTFPPFAVVLKGSKDQTDVLATGNVVASIEIDPPGYTLRHNKTFLTRGEGVFYHLSVVPVPEEPFNLVASVDIVYTGTVRYPLFRRHMVTRYPVVERPPLRSDEITVARPVPTEDETELLRLRREVEAWGEPVVPVEDEVKSFYVNHFGCACKMGSDAGRAAAEMFSSMQHHDTESGKVSLVLFSGNGFSPSIHSSVTRAACIPNILNALCIDAAGVGHRDLDFGLPRFDELAHTCRFPWVLSNIVDTRTRRPLKSAVTSAVIQIPGSNAKLGIVGLVEEEWLASNVSLCKDYTYKDAVSVAKDLSHSLRKTCNVIVAMTQMRLAGEVALAESTQGVIDIIFSGYNKDAFNQVVGGVPIVRSGGDFESFSRVEVKVKGGRVVAVPCTELIKVAGCVPDVSILQTAASAGSRLEPELHQILTTTTVDLNVEPWYIGTREAEVGNLISDVMWKFYEPVGVQVAVVTAGCLRSGKVLWKGPLTVSDMFEIVPFEDPVVVVQVLGLDLVGALEEWVADCPQVTERFPHISGLKVTVDTAHPPGSRVVEVTYRHPQGWSLLRDTTLLSVALPNFLTSAPSLSRCKKQIPPEQGVILPAILRTLPKTSTPILEDRITILT